MVEPVPEPDLAPARARLDRLVRRLHGFSPRAWTHGDRAAVVRRLAADLAHLGAPGRPLPALPDHALADMVAVLGRDALAAGRVADVRRLVDAALEATR